MIYRPKFVTNSSSSSYIGWGYRITSEDVKHLSDDQLDELYDIYSWGEAGPHFINEEEGQALIIQVAHHSEDFVDFIEDDQLKKIEWNDTLLEILKKYGITPSGNPMWVVSHSYG
jgi:hypothetical protein